MGKQFGVQRVTGQGALARQPACALRHFAASARAAVRATAGASAGK